MPINSTGKNLIFLISQPRAGSTLTQAILGSHPDIYTVSEPWLMLHPIYALRPENYQVEYNAKLANVGLQEFLNILPDGEETYFEGIRIMYSYLYETALNTSGKPYFLDKTPRYYHIIPELYKIFPDAHYIILLRNPLAVLCSIINTWVNGKWDKLKLYKNDLLSAPNLLLQGIQHLQEKCIVLHYEKLLENPEAEISQLCQKLELEFIPSMINYGEQNHPQWRFGDPKNLYENTKPNSQHSDHWKHSLKDAQTWQVVNDYLAILGEETITQMGYSYEELQEIIQTYCPSTLSLKELLEIPITQQKQG
jgi:hypothetical protein